ncbi:hypothetical protein F6Y05_34795 [Bacillus megaterium]|nr:hypothetical protein [Priestia megaterium]
MELTYTKVERTEKFATFTMSNGIAVAVSLTPMENYSDRFLFMTSNMRIGKLIVRENDNFLVNDDDLVNRTTEYFNRYLNFSGISFDSSSEKVRWFMEARLPIVTRKNLTKMKIDISDVFKHCYQNIKYEYDKYQQKKFTLRDIDNCIKEFISGHRYNQQKRSFPV